MPERQIHISIIVARKKLLKRTQKFTRVLLTLPYGLTENRHKAYTGHLSCVKIKLKYIYVIHEHELAVKTPV